MPRRRRLDQDLIAKLYTENHNLARQLEQAADLATKRYELLQAVYRENEALRVELIARKPLLPQGRHTAPMTRQRSLMSPRPLRWEAGQPTLAVDLTKAGDETELMMQPGWSA